MRVLVFEFVELHEDILVLTVYYELEFGYSALKLGVFLVEGTLVQFQVAVEHTQTEVLGLHENELSPGNDELFHKYVVGENVVELTLVDLLDFQNAVVEVVVEEEVVLVDVHLVLEVLALEIGVQVQEVLVVGHQVLRAVSLVMHHYLGGVVDQVHLVP